MTQYTWFLAELTTGKVVGELELASVDAERRLGGNGSFDARVDMSEWSRDRRRDVIEATTPGRFTVILDRDGVVFGEWIIWSRVRPSGFTPMQITGNELLSYMDKRLTWSWNYIDLDQLDIARNLVVDAFNGEATGKVAVNVNGGTSGRRRDRTYRIEEVASSLQRLKELSEVDDGFEYDITSSWQEVNGFRYVRRDVNFYYPRKGTGRPFLLEVPDQDGFGGNAISVEVSENARLLGSAGYAVGGEKDTGEKVLGVSTTGDTLIAKGYPFMQVSGSYYSVKEQDTIDAHAVSLVLAGQDSELPWKLTVLGSEFPDVEDYNTGDSLWVVVEEQPNFPDGADGRMRVLSKKLKATDSVEEQVEIELVIDTNAFGAA